jgi:hypothetical protein
MPSQFEAFDQASGVFFRCHSSLQAEYRGVRWSPVLEKSSKLPI